MASRGVKRRSVPASRRAAALGGLARRLARTRGKLMARWLDGIAEPHPQSDATADAAAEHGLTRFFACVLAEVRAALLAGGSDGASSSQAGVALPGDFWPIHWQVSDLFRSVESLRDCLKSEIRDYFGHDAAFVDAHTRAHEIVERTFCEIMEKALEMQAQRHACHVVAAQASLHDALAALKGTEERLRVATSAAGIGIFEWCGGSRTSVWENRQMYEITGQPEERGPLTEKEFMTSVVHPADTELLRSHFRASLATGEPVHVAFRLHRVCDRALRTVEMFGYLRSSAGEDGYTFIGSLCDVTQRAEAEAELRDADRRKDVFLATLAHELRNPLAPVRNAAHLLGQSAGADPAKREWLRDVIERQTGHLSHLIDDLLDVSRITTGKVELKRQVFDIRLALEHALEITLPAALQRCLHVVRLPLEHPVYIDGDPARITQTFTNLLDNAIKYSDDGGRIVVGATVNDGHVCVTVSDTGLGISGDALPHVFDLFAQGSGHGESSRGGLGIGLSVCKALVEMHGGAIVATSEGRNRGSRFEIRLPVCHRIDDRASAPLAPGQKPHASLRVLIVDDNKDAALSLAMILDHHNVRTAHSGEEALEIAEAFEPEIVFLDLGLPGISGFEVARRLKDKQALTPGRPLEIVAMSGYGQPQDIARSSAAGCDGHLVKPVDVEALLATITRLTDEKEAGRKTGSTPRVRSRKLRIAAG